MRSDPGSASTRAVGVVLAAGAGTRMGTPKALVRSPAGVPWPTLAVEALRAGGCAEVVVVLGAAADEARHRVPADPDVRVVVARTGRPDRERPSPLASVPSGTRTPPASPSSTCRRCLPGSSGASSERVRPRGVLRRAVFGERPGHPVLVGAAHRAALVAAVTADPGDRSAGRLDAAARA